MGGLRFRGVKLRDLASSLLTYPPIEEYPKGCRGLRMSVGSSSTLEKYGKGALCGSRLPQRTTYLA